MKHHDKALATFIDISRKFPNRADSFLGQARIYDFLAQQYNYVKFAEKSIEAYKRYLAFDELIEIDADYLEAAQKCTNHMRSLGYLSQAMNVQKALVNRFPNDPKLRNQLAVTMLMLERYQDAQELLITTRKKWPYDGFSLTLLGYTLKIHSQNYQEAAELLQKGIESQDEGTQEARFYIALGEAFERLGHFENATAVYRRGAALQLFPSAHQRSVYNQPNLRAKPIWSLEDTTHGQELQTISAQWQTIRDEGLRLLYNDTIVKDGSYFREEGENLLATGSWKELVLFSRGERHVMNCRHATITCRLLENFKPAVSCRRGQVKFSVLQPGTHIWSHCGPTNTRLRAHLGLVVPPHRTTLRVVNETLKWTLGEFIVFDDSFEHEVWHEGEHLRMILVIDFWHPDLTDEQTQQLAKV